MGSPDKKNTNPAEQAKSAEQEGLDIAETLPELKLNTSFKSDEPIQEILKFSHEHREEIENIVPWNNYTIITIKSKPQIFIFDENGQIIEDKSHTWLSSYLINRRSFNKISDKYQYISRGVKHQSQVAAISKLPYELQGIALQIFKGFSESIDYFAIGDFPTQDIRLDNIKIIGKYIIFFNSGGVYTAFSTEDENGVILPPDKWIKITPDDEIPAELNGYVEKIATEMKTNSKQLNEQYTAVINPVGISIMKKGETKAGPVFAEKLPSIGYNSVIDPNDPNKIYYCSAINPKGMAMTDISGEPASWKTVIPNFSEKYEVISDLKLDPGGNFFIFQYKKDIVIITKDSLQEVKRMPGHSHLSFDGQGRICAVDDKGFLVYYEANFQELAVKLDEFRNLQIAKGMQSENIFDLKAKQKKAEAEEKESMASLLPLQEIYTKQLNEALATITTSDGLIQLREQFAKIRQDLQTKGLKPKEVNFVIKGLEDGVVEKEKEFASKEAKEVLIRAQAILAGSLSLASAQDARHLLESVKPIIGLLDQDLRLEINKVTQEIQEKAKEFFNQRAEEIIKDVKGIVKRTQKDLDSFTSKAQMDDWLEFRMPQIKASLASLAHDCPLEAEEAYSAIMTSLAELQTLAGTYEQKFKQEYAQVREKAAQRMESWATNLEADIDNLIERLHSKSFMDRKAAEDYVNNSEARKTVEVQIAALTMQDPARAKELKKALNVRLSNVLTEIERGAQTNVAETGQQMVMFGKTPFPKWEAKVKEKSKRKVELTFAEDPATHGPGIKAGDILGDVVLAVKGSSGKITKMKPYEGLGDENEWRLGLLSYAGESIPPSYLSASDFKMVKKDYIDWENGKDSKLRQEYEKLRADLKEIFSQRRKMIEEILKDRNLEKTAENRKTVVKEVEAQIKPDFEKKVKEYADFVAEHRIMLLRRIDKMKDLPEIEYSNGKGLVPEWKSHWVVDTQSEQDLEKMARALKMQTDLQEGMLNLKGHAGTGKDVRLQMFCATTNRPYFPTDCTKWTTEYELSEDVVLEAEGGASKTVKIPSVVLNGITTPGAVVYFNEFNAMPEQAQIFLHALMDEKRSLTLKTSSGKTIRALPSVLLVSSMNPGYPGTFEPQFATRSRMVSIEIDYPPLTRKADKSDANQNPMYDASEALRMARDTSSLADLTYEASLDRNEFVKIWDKYINGIENGASNPVGTQKFDIDTILAVVQFTNNLRDSFIKIFEKVSQSQAQKALPVKQPITGRELRRCAYLLSVMNAEGKATADPEAVAKELIAEVFLPAIDKKEDRDKIKNAMATWTSQKRIG